jgi:hypothetical protein
MFVFAFALASGLLARPVPAAVPAAAPRCRADRPMLVGVSTETAASLGFAEWWADSDEEVADRPITVQGSLPTWLNGRLVRNGPGRWRAPDGSRTLCHAFDGLAKLVRSRREATRLGLRRTHHVPHHPDVAGRLQHRGRHSLLLDLLPAHGVSRRHDV